MKQPVLRWDEMKASFPDEWLLITHYEVDEMGNIITGVIERHSKNRDDIAYPPVVDQNTAFRFTGESRFAGLRSHAANHHAV